VLEVVYLIFNEGYSATSGGNWVRPSLCEDALRLGRLLAGLAPREPEVHGLLALMEIQASRLAARLGPAGEPVLLLDQDRAKWDQTLIVSGLAALAQAEALGGASRPYVLQAAIAACHARAKVAAETDWPRIVALYARLMSVQPSPVVALNRAVAVSMAQGPQRSRRPAAEARPLPGGARGVPARCRAHPERTRAQAATGKSDSLRTSIRLLTMNRA
jgi:predicted RNA polymerase sigma factor